MLIVVDSREQCPFPFAHERYGAKTKQGALTVGDYSLAGLEDKVAVERKSLPDLVACLGRERERRWMPSPWSVRTVGWSLPVGSTGAS